MHDLILWMKSEKTGKKFPTVQFSADTDVATAGWVSLTSRVNHDLVVTTMTDYELNQTTKDASGYQIVEARVNRALKRTDLVCTWLAQVVEPSYDVDIATLSFQDYRKIAKPPRLLYRDIYSDDGYATVETEVSRREFERKGGTFLVV